MRQGIWQRKYRRKEFDANYPEMSIKAAFEPGSRRHNRREDSAFRGKRSQRLHPHYAGWCTPGPRPRERTLLPGAPGGSSGLEAGVIPEGARKSIGGRGSGDGHLPSASQSNHFPNLLFCSAAAGAKARAACAVIPAGRPGIRNKITLLLGWFATKQLKFIQLILVIAAKGPTGRLRASFYPTRVCRPLQYPE